MPNTCIHPDVPDPENCPHGCGHAPSEDVAFLSWDVTCPRCGLDFKIAQDSSSGLNPNDASLQDAADLKASLHRCSS